MARDETTGTPATLRSINDRVALSILLADQPMSRNQLSVRADVSKPTASLMVRRLENAGIIEVVGMVSGGRGPNTALYGVRMERLLGVAIDVQDDRMLSTVVDAAGSAQAVASTPRTPGQGAVDEVRVAVQAACRLSGSDIGSVVAVSVGVQASVATRTDQLLLPSSLSGWPEHGARELIRRSTGWSVALANDVNLAATAERTSGSGRGTDSFALLWIGHGIGFAADIGGRTLLGSRGAAGEIGTLRIPGTDSGPERLDDLFEPAEIAAVAGRHDLPTSIVDLAAALAASPTHGPFLAELAPRIAAAIPAAVAILDPEVVILGGPLGAAGGPHLARLVTDALVGSGDPVPLIVTAAIAANPVLVGAKETLRDEIRTRLLDEAGSHVSA